MAKNKKRRQQGVVSWLTSVIALGIGLSGVFSVLKTGGLRGLASQATGGITAGQKFQLDKALLVYGPMLGGIVFKKFASMLVKTARVQSILPRFG